MAPLTPFPFEPLRAGEVTPSPGPGDAQELLQRDVRIVRWFVEQAGWTTALVKPESTLGQLLAACEQVDLTMTVPAIEVMDRERARHYLHAFAAVGRIAWAVRALHGNGGAADRVDAGFIKHELLADDSKEKSIERKLPAGVGTLVFAARLVQAGGGRVCINGHRGVGLEPKTKGDKVDFFSPHALSMKPRELMYRVAPLVVRALGRDV